ncbi:hypothetical protein F5Y18DRAFT_58933 [Xylariaceae sp. FL1019]|nr:hypothetical protein F5Y18DRAFT_58933 [Xylariaceae sp. FL1019]
MERKDRVKIAFVDFSDPENVSQKTCENELDLSSVLAQRARYEDGDKLNQLYVVEDLSSKVMELLGAALDIDPFFFRSHLEDHTWFNITDDWIEMPELESQAYKRSFVTIKYMQPRFFEDASVSQAAKDQAGKWNVLRRIDFEGQVKSGRNAWWENSPHEVGLLRRKVSIWSSKQGDKWTGVVLVDPCISEGHALWNGYGRLDTPPKMMSTTDSLTFRQPEMPIFDAFLSCISTLSPEDCGRLVADPENITSHVYPMVFAEILVTLQYAFTGLFQIEWQLDSERTRKLEDLDTALDSLHKWQRRLPFYVAWVRDAITGIEGRYDLWQQSAVLSPFTSVKPGEPLLRTDMAHVTQASGWQSGIRRDFISMLARLQALQLRADKIMKMAVAIISVEEGKKAMNESRNMGRITYLAFVFVPLSFVTSLLSMNPDISATKALVYAIFFAVSIPVSIVALFVAMHWNKILIWWEEQRSAKKQQRQQKKKS